MDASKILLDVRGQLEISRAAAARLYGISPSTVGRIEKGELDPTWGTLSRILEASGFQICGERITPTGDATASVAARLVLDQVLSHPVGGPPDFAAMTSQSGPEELQVWWDRWRRAGWLSDTSSNLDIGTVVRIGALISRRGRRAVPHLFVDHKRRWRELALRIDEAGFDYAVSDTAAALESPGVGLMEVPRIYVADPALVASVLNLRESLPGQGIPLVTAERPELDDLVVGHAVRFTSLGHALMDGLAGTESEQQRASRLVFQLLVDVYLVR